MKKKRKKIPHVTIHLTSTPIVAGPRKLSKRWLRPFKEMTKAQLDYLGLDKDGKPLPMQHFVSGDIPR